MRIEEGYYPLKAYRFNSFAVEFTLHYDIDDYTFYAQLKNKKGEIVATFSIIKGDDFIILTLDSATLLELTAGTYKYDVKQVSNGGANVIIKGEFELLNGVTELP